MKLVRKISSNTIVVVLSIVISLLLLELTFRVYNFFFDLVDSSPNVITYKNNPNNPRKYDAELGWLLKPGYNKNGVVINQDGFRSSIEKSVLDLDKSKILVLGASTVFGLRAQQEEIFTEKLIKPQSQSLYATRSG